MNKGVFGRHFSRTKNQRTALFRGLIGSLIENDGLLTTVSKAKAIKADAEKIITKAKDGSVADKRVIFQTLNKKALVDKLVNEIAPVFKERKGGYLKIVRLGSRKGDQAQMAKLLFTQEIVRTELVKKTTGENQTDNKKGKQK